MSDPKKILEKYHDIIAEEVNVKKVSLLDDNQQVNISYIPLGNKLWEQFGKDTGRIIWSAKQWNAELKDGKLIVRDGDDSWELSEDQYEIRYSGFDGENQIVEEWAMIELDLTMTDDLIQEGMAREISRFLNQMRKDADYTVSDRIQVWYETKSELLTKIISDHEEYLQNEALVSEFVAGKIDGELDAEFELDEEKVRFFVKK